MLRMCAFQLRSSNETKKGPLLAAQKERLNPEAKSQMQ